MRKRILILFFCLFLFSFTIYSNEAKIDDSSSLINSKHKLSFNGFSCNNRGNIAVNLSNRLSKNNINYFESNLDNPKLTKKQTIDFMVAGGIFIGGGVILAGLGGLCIGLFYYFWPLLNTTENYGGTTFTFKSNEPYAFIALAGVCFGISGLFLLAGIIFVAVGAAVFNKYYKNNNLSFFINSNNTETKLGFTIKI